MGRLSLILVFTIYLGACSTTTQVKDFKDVQKGMDKSEVIDLLGSPKNSYHANGKDVWNYEVYENDKLYRREVHFQKGKVIFNGKSPVVKSSSKLNGETNQHEDKEFKEYKKSLKDKKMEKEFKDIN